MANTAIPFYSSGTSVALTPNWAKRLVLQNAPAVMEFGLTVGAGTELIVFKGDVTAGQLKETLDACADLAGYAVDVFGGTQVSSTGPDGVALHSGEFIVMLGGALPYPVWGVVQNSEVQSFIVEDGETGGAPSAVTTEAGSGSINGTWELDPAAVGPLLTLQKGGDASAKLRDTGSGWVIDAPGFGYTFYTNPSTDPTPPASGWEVGPNALAPAPTVAYTGGDGYSLNAGNLFYLGITEADLQANQRALGSSYADVIIKGISYGNDPPMVLTGGKSIRIQGSIIGDDNIDMVFDGNFANEQDLGGTTQPAIFIYDRGETAPPLHIVEAVGSGGSYSGGNMEISLETSSDMVNWSTPVDISEIMLGYTVGPGYKTIDFTLQRYARFQIYRITGDGTALGEINLFPEPNTALFYSYFPFSVGDVTTPSTTGVNTTTHTLYTGHSDSSLVTVSDADIEGLFIAGMQNPTSQAAPPFTPHDSHWYNPDPATSGEAVNRLAAMLYNWLWEPIY